MLTEPYCKVQNHSHYRGCDGRKCGGERLDVPHALDEGRAGEDEEKAWQKRRPCRDRRPERAGEEGRKPAGVLPGADEADKLQHHDKRPRCGFCKGETCHHLGGLQPVIMLHSLLRHVRQHGIGASKSDQSRFAEKDPLLKKYVTPPAEKSRERNGRDPQRQTSRHHTKRAPRRRPWFAPCRTRAAALRVSDRDEKVRTQTAARQTQQRCCQDDGHEGEL